MKADTIMRVVARGEGVTADGRYAALAAPGDTLNADGSVTPGPHHQAPPCRHFPICGGCQLQHLDDAAYAQFVTDRIAAALAAHDLETDIRAPILSPPRTRRRATLHAEAKGGRVSIGFTEQSSHALVDIQECHVFAPELFAVVAPLRKLLARLGMKRRADIQMTSCDQGVDLLVGARADGLAAAEAIIAFCQANGVARFAIDDGLGPETRWEPEPVTVTLGGVPVPFPHGAFLQATADGEAALVSAVREAVGGAATIADLFAGLGTFALSLGGKVYAAEAARDAILSLKSAAGQAGRQVFADHRDLYRRPLTVQELDRFDAIVLDPPRAGARDQAVALASARTPVIAYVSCNPSSFARDALALCDGGYALDWVQPVGQFRWSTHVELAARFSR
ncbi:class I SAM-dependent RNA methyltransferase [Sphingomonas panacisoli]|uniref:Class I SAM-dependent RNA methyltransferase n=1 Tax=Sphingomonas panacisoli TaxID=1813879 RepID=A0A5B8LI67_9SPHN|nr:class I SAM-dependent RNA methyltransferase [Sphingomonas panacisoli]QDZ07586.1 class I SAM-dependent RNA methyltransferase [Sphingomonas panacisoli]